MHVLRYTISTLALGLCACGDGTGGNQQARPNVLLVSIDTLRADHLGFHGYGRPTSPQLDAFAETAIVFENAQSSAPWTLPSLASIFTSNYTSTHGCWTLGSRLDESFETLPEIMTSAGYDSAAIASHRLCSPTFGISQGFVHNDFELCDQEGRADEFITSQQISDRGIRFLNQKHAAPDGKPWLLWVHYFDPHDAYMPQPDHSADFPAIEGGRKDVDRYDAEIAFTDKHVGRLLAALESNGQDQNTIVVFFSDHGEEFKDHGKLGHGATLYAEMLHIPLAIRIPGQAAQRIRSVVRSVDLMPTLLELCELATPDSAEGLSLMPIISGQEKSPRLSFAEVGMRGLKPFESVQEGNLKWIQERGGQGGQLFDVAADPGELNNLAEQRPDVAARLAEALERMRASAQQRGELFQHSEISLPPDSAGDLGALGYLDLAEEDDD